jgi:hypothetical protein
VETLILSVNYGGENRIIKRVLQWDAAGALRDGQLKRATKTGMVDGTEGWTAMTRLGRSTFPGKSFIRAFLPTNLPQLPTLSLRPPSN